jgi:hypothetical protein
MSTCNEKGSSSGRSKPDSLTVRCYSGQSYAERPKSFTWQDKEYEVAEIEKEWRGEGTRNFRVRTKDNKLFQLCYNESQDQWSLTGGVSHVKRDFKDTGKRRQSHR